MNCLNSFLPKKIFKGDQNLLWDGFLTDFYLYRFLQKCFPDSQFIPFMHDEKIGAADVNMIYCMQDQESPYFFSEDYADSAGDACYINIDGSFGLFYLPVVEEDRLRYFGVHLRSTSKQFINIKRHLDASFIRGCAEAGILLDFSEVSTSTIGKMLNQDIMDCYFSTHPFQQLFFLFSKSHGRFGLVPTEDKNILLSSLSCKDPSVRSVLKEYLHTIFFNGAVQYTDPVHLNAVTQRIDLLEQYLEKHHAWEETFTDWQLCIVRFMEESMQSNHILPYTTTSYLFRHPQEFTIGHTFYDLLRDKPELFMECYNEALNETRMSIQRLTVKGHLMNIPFYINLVNQNGVVSRTPLYMNVLSKSLFFRDKGRWNEVNTLSNQSFITGKAIPFLNEFRLLDKTIALPESGSKYSPACHAMVRFLQDRGVNLPVSNIIRIGLHFLDHLYIKTDYQLKIPPILQPFFGSTLSTEEFSKTWKKVCENIEMILEETRHYEEDQQVRIIEKWTSDPVNPAISYMDQSLRNLMIQTFHDYREARDKKCYKASDSAIFDFQLEKWKLKLLVDFHKQRLVQVMDGLRSLNNRPYSLSVFLMFGPDFIWELYKYVTFRDESG